MRKKQVYKAATGILTAGMLLGEILSGTGLQTQTVSAADLSSEGTETAGGGQVRSENKTVVTRIQAENDAYVTLDPGIGTDMGSSFVVEKEAASDEGAHIKTSMVGATVTLRFNGTGVRFYTKKGNGAGNLSVSIDGNEYDDISEYVSGSAQFKTKVFEAENISSENEDHVLVLTTKTAENVGANFNFDYFEIISEEEEIEYIQSPGNTTYYLDSSAEDGGDGKSEDEAFDSLDDINGYQFAAGDRILIKAGSEFQGQLYPKGSGTEDAPVVIDMYGEGEKPLIDGNGRYSNAPSVNDDGPFGEAGAAVYLYNQQYWEINNLRVTNWSSDGVDRERSGIRVEASGGGTYRHIYIRNCEISDIRGYDGQDSIWDVVPENGGTTFYGARTTHRTGGINIVSYTKRDTSAGLGTAGEILDEEPTIFDDVLIEDNTIENCHANGITTTNVRGELDDKDYRHTNVVIRGNEIRNVQRAGIVPLYTSGVLVEKNLVDTFQQTTKGYGCGIWCDRADNMLFQYNEVCNGQNTMDGMAFNLDDMTENGIIQYNYSHNNVGGGVMLHVRTNSYNRNNIVRYNLSVNDTRGYAAHQAIIVCVGEDSSTKIENAKIYNNTFVNTNTVHPVYQGNEILFANNIFYLPNQGMASKADAYTLGAKTTFINNVFAGAHSSSEPSGNGNVQTDDPLLAGRLDGTESLEEAMEKAMLSHESPALGIGDTTVLADAETDFYGNAAVIDGKCNAGIYNGESVDRLPDSGDPDPGTDPEFGEEPSEDEYDVEYIEAEDDAVIKSGAYTLASGSQSEGHANTHIYFAGTGSYAEYTFTGKAISVYTKTGPGAGVATIYLDGEEAAADDQYTAVQEYNKRAYTVVFEEEGLHTIRVENSGNRNPSSSGNTVNLDCFKIFHEKEKNVDLTELEKVITLADEYAAEIDSYTEDTAEAFWTAYNAAKTVLADAEADQEEVDNAAAALQAAIDGLKLAEEISTAVLEYALKLAENVDTEGVADSVVEIFNDRKAAAQDILERAKDGDPSVTQSMVDESWQGLIEIIQYMSFKPGDMTDLQKVVDLANTMDLTKYLEKGQQEFTDALAAAEAILGEEFTEQSKINEAWQNLLTAMSELRLKPSKGALEELIASAQSLSTEGVSEETAAVFRSALARAVSVYEDEQATKEEVVSAEEELQTAIDQMLASAGGTENPGQGTDGSSTDDLVAGGQTGSESAGGGSTGTTGSTGAGGSTNTSGSQNSGNRTTASGSSVVKTGDTASAGVLLWILAGSGVLAVCAGRKRKKS